MSPYAPGAGRSCTRRTRSSCARRSPPPACRARCWAAIDEVEQLEAFGAEAGWPLILKTSRGGYDGRGVWVVDSYAEASALIASTTLNPGARWLAEEKVDFVQELSAQVARSPHGQAVAYPVVRTVQTNGICTEVVAPAPGLTDDEAVAAQQAALTVAKALDVVGHARGRDVRDPRRPRARQRARDAPAQLRPLVDRRRGRPRSSRTTCARCSTCRSATRPRSRRTP